MVNHFFSDLVPVSFSDIVIHDPDDGKPSKEEVLEAHEPSSKGETFDVEVVNPHSGFEVFDANEFDDVPEEADVVVSRDGEPALAIDFGDLPGAPPGTEDPAVEDESEEELIVEEEPANENSGKSKETSSESKKDDKWDWRSKGFGQFTVWVNDRFQAIPRHTGYDLGGLERAMSYLEKLHGEISKAMRTDVDGELDANQIAKIHDKIDEGIEKLEKRIEAVKTTKSKKKKKASQDQEMIVKEAQKIFGVQNGVVITVPLFIASLGRVLMNSMVSSGKDIEDSYRKLAKKYKLTDREKMELIQFLSDMGMPMIHDRGLLPDEEFDPRSSENFDYESNYSA